MQVDSTCLGMCMELHVPVASNCQGMGFSKWFWGLRREGFPLLLIPFGEAVEVARSIDEPMWAIHEMIVSCAVSEPKGDPVLFCEDEAVLLTFNTTSANIWRQVVRVDGASSVLGLATAISLFSVKGSLCLCSWSSL